MAQENRESKGKSALIPEKEIHSEGDQTLEQDPWKYSRFGWV